MAKTESRPDTFQTRVKRFLFRGASMRERARREWRTGRIEPAYTDSYCDRPLGR